MEGKKKKIAIGIFCIAICCLAYQFLFPEKMSSILGKHMKHSSEITVTMLDNDNVIGYKTSSDADMAKLRDWGDGLKCRIYSVGNDLFSKKEDTKKYIFTFINSDGSMTSLSLNATGEISESIKRYKITHFSDSVYEDLNKILGTWEQL